MTINAHIGSIPKAWAPITLAAAIKAASKPSSAIDFEFSEPAEMAVSTTSKAIEIIKAVNKGAIEVGRLEEFVTSNGHPNAIKPKQEPSRSKIGVTALLMLASKFDGINNFFNR
jgi:hypothetical protein